MLVPHISVCFCHGVMELLCNKWLGFVCGKLDLSLKTEFRKLKRFNLCSDLVKLMNYEMTKVTFFLLL